MGGYFENGFMHAAIHELGTYHEIRFLVAIM